MTVRLQALLFAAVLGASTSGLAQTSQAPDPPVRFELPTVIVAVEKRPQDVLNVPVSVTTVQRETLQSAGMRYVNDAARLAPNVFIHEFSARKLSNPRFRGIGSGPNNPGVTTYIDGVPQLNTNSSSLELIDVNQIEFARGPQSALWGRNTVGGLITIASRPPSRDAWTGELTAPFGNRALRDVRASVSGPVVADRVSIGFAAGYSARDGYTVNDATGNTLDDRSAAFGKVQMLFTPGASWDARVIVSAERARDGDYALQDLGQLRRNPFHASRDFEGFTHRDVVAPTVLLTYRGSSVDVSSTTGLVRWKTFDRTDLDYTALPLITRDNTEKDVQFTQEVRFASAAAAPIVMSPTVNLRWQAGVSGFTQNYEQDAFNIFAPFVLSPFVSSPTTRRSPITDLDDLGFGAYGQGTWSIRERVDVTAGARFDYERKEARRIVFPAFRLEPRAVVGFNAVRDPAADEDPVLGADFTHVSPQFSATFRATPRVRIYGTVAQGFRAGGFNAASPAGREAYGQEDTWNYEGGVKSSLLGQRLSLSVAVFHIDWNDIQLNVPNPAVPAQFFISNSGRAGSSGVELELAARPYAGVDLFASVGSTAATFKSGTESSGVPVGGNRLPDTPRYTANAGGELSHAMTAGASLFVRGDVTVYGDRFYDEFNSASQDTYALTNVQFGVRGTHLFGEGWVRNAFDTRYVPLALAYPGLAPSGFIGEPGAPRTFGVRLGMRF
jgi:iron complex outermembrane receptor protein